MNKPKKAGEGDRERRPSLYGEGGRAVGGQARRANFKKIVLPEKKLTVKDVPEPGAQPDFLVEEAMKFGEEPPKNSAFNKLKILQASILSRNSLNQNAASDANGEDPTSPDILEELFPKIGEKERPIRSREERKERTKKQAERRPILRIAVETEDDEHPEIGLAGTPLREDLGAGKSSRSINSDNAPISVSVLEKKELENAIDAEDKVDGRFGTLHSSPEATDGVSESLPGGYSNRDSSPDGIDGQEQSNLNCVESERGLSRAECNSPTVGDSAGESARGSDPHRHVEKEPLHSRTGDSARRSDRSCDEDRTGSARDEVSLRAPESGKRKLPIYDQASPVREGVTPYSPHIVSGLAALLELPGALCNTCPMGEGLCPKFEANHTCWYEENMESLSSRDKETFLPQLEYLADIDFKRATRAVMIEQRMTGQTGNDPGVTRLIQQARTSRIQLEEIKTPVRAQAERSITVIAKESGGPATQPGQGLIAQLIANMSAPKALPAPTFTAHEQIQEAEVIQDADLQ